MKHNGNGKKLKSFKDLTVWQLASDFSKNIALLVKSFPRDEQYKLSDDFVRAARSIAANISEGWGRFFPKEKISFYNIARGSAEECKNHVIEAYNCSYIDSSKSEKLQKKAHIISIKLTNLITATRKRIKTPTKRVSRSSKTNMHSDAKHRFSSGSVTSGSVHHERDE